MNGPQNRASWEQSECLVASRQKAVLPDPRATSRGARDFLCREIIALPSPGFEASVGLSESLGNAPPRAYIVGAPRIHLVGFAIPQEGTLVLEVDSGQPLAWTLVIEIVHPGVGGLHPKDMEHLSTISQEIEEDNAVLEHPTQAIEPVQIEVISISTQACWEGNVGTDAIEGHHITVSASSGRPEGDEHRSRMGPAVNSTAQIRPQRS